MPRLQRAARHSDGGAAPNRRLAMGGYQQLVRGEPFRGKFRKSFEKPVPFEPGKPDRITFALPDIAHTFRAGHRIMVQIQSSLVSADRSQPAEVHGDSEGARHGLREGDAARLLGGADGSRITVHIVE